MVSKIDHWAGEPNVSVHLRRTIVLRCCLLARTDEMGKVGLRIESEKSVKGRGGQTNDVLLKGGKD